MRVLLIIFMSVAFGFIVGSIPFLQEHLHWNLWFIFPISGLIFGIALGWLQFKGSYVLNSRVSFLGAFFLSFIVVISYFMTDVGIYLTEKIFAGSFGGTQIYHLMSFSNYMSMRLGDSTLEGLRSHATIDVSAAVNKILYVVDLICAGVAAFFTILTLSMDYPYCSPCKTYQKSHHKYEILPRLAGEPLEQVLSSIVQINQRQEYLSMAKLLVSLEREKKNEYSNVKIRADRRVCPQCRESVILGQIFFKHENGWKAIPELSFSVSSSKII